MPFSLRALWICTVYISFESLMQDLLFFKKRNRKHAQIKPFYPLTGIPMQSFDSVTIDTDLESVCSEQVQQHLNSALSNRTGTCEGILLFTILTYACLMSCVLNVMCAECIVQFYRCYNPFFIVRAFHSHTLCKICRQSKL